MPHATSKPPLVITRKYRQVVRTPKQLAAEDRGRLLAVAVCEDAKCRKCGRKSKLHVHHINGDPLDNRPKNLEALCASCHQKHHRSLERRKLTNWLANIDAVNEGLGLAKVRPSRLNHLPDQEAPAH